jgi:hypothetical protein
VTARPGVGGAKLAGETSVASCLGKSVVRRLVTLRLAAAAAAAKLERRRPAARAAHWPRPQPGSLGLGSRPRLDFKFGHCNRDRDTPGDYDPTGTATES